MWIVTVQTEAATCRFYSSCKCEMQMSPSGDSFMTAVDSLRCSQGSSPMTPIRRANLLSDWLHIGSIIQRAHQIDGLSWDRKRHVVVVFVWDTKAALGDALWYFVHPPHLPLPTLTSHLLSSARIYHNSDPLFWSLLLDYHAFHLNGTYTFNPYHIYCLTSLSFDSFFLFEHFLNNLNFFFMSHTSSKLYPEPTFKYQ